MYEGGTHIVRFATTTNNAALDTVLQAYNYSPEVANVHRTLLIAWDTFGNDGFAQYKSVIPASSWGSWGAKRWMTDTQPRWAVLDAYNKGQALPVAATRPAQVTNLVAISSDARVSLSWMVPANNGAAITDYLVERNVNGGGWETIVEGVSSATAYIDTGRVHGVAIQNRVSAINLAGIGDASALASAKP